VELRRAGTTGYTDAISPRGTGSTLRIGCVIQPTPALPLLPFDFLARGPALLVAIISSAVVLFGVGVYSALTRVGSWWKNGLKMVCIGLGAAALGFAIGRLFHASGG